MARSAFYIVPSDAYIFREVLTSSDERQRPEEPVRQWCAFELIRAYGVNVSDLEFERPVKVGSVKYRIDITVMRDRKPWVVIECKKRKETNPNRGIEQALSYANAEGIKAEFAIYTNGEAWVVKRRVGDRWIGVPDLPTFSGGGSTEPIVNVLSTLQDVQPLLFQLGERCEGRVARRYMDALQRFFYTPNLITDGANRYLLHATDNLLRVLQAPPWDSHYRMDKTAAACGAFGRFATETTLGTSLPSFGNEDLRTEMLHLHAVLADMAEGCSALPAIDALVLRLDVTLTEYGIKLGASGDRHPEIEARVHGALHAVIDFGLKVHLNVALPDSIDRIWQADVKEYCRVAWETFDVDPLEPTRWELLLGLFLQPFKRRSRR